MRAKLLSVGIISTTLLTATPVYAAEATPTNYEIVEEMGLGFNLGKTFSATIDSRVNLQDIQKRIDKAYYEGFNTIRIPVQFTKMIDEDGYIVDQGTMSLVQDTVDYAYDKGMYVVLGSMFDLGDNANSYWDLSDVKSTEFVHQYTNMWSDIAETFSEDDYDYHLIFEGYNEVKNYYGSVTTAPDGSDYTFGYKDAKSQAPDTYYFAGRCGNIDYMQTLNEIWGDVMESVAPNRYYFVSSYAGSPVAAYTDYSSLMWGTGGKLSTYDYNLNGGWGTCWLHWNGVNQDKAIYSFHDYELGNLTKHYDSVKNFFNSKKIKMPIYVGEYGTHTTNLNSVGKNLVNITAKLNERGTGGCLWDDTQSMSFLEYWKWEWFKPELMKDLISAAGQSSREVNTDITITLETFSNGPTIQYTVPVGSTADDVIDAIWQEGSLSSMMQGMEWVDGEYKLDMSNLTYKKILILDIERDVVFNEDTTIRLNLISEKIPGTLQTVWVYGVEQSDKTSATKPYIKLKAPKGTTCENLINYIYENYDLPEKDGYEFVGFYQEGARPSFLYEDSGRLINGWTNLYAKFRPID